MFRQPEALTDLKDIEEEYEELAKLMTWSDNQQSNSEECEQLGPLLIKDFERKKNIPSIIKPSKLELEPLPNLLMYVFLKQFNTLPMIIFALFTSL